MKRNRIIRYLLLNETNELSWWGRWRLRRALRRDPQAAQVQADIDSLQQSFRESSKPEGPAPHIVERIKQEAAAHRDRQDRRQERLAPEPFVRLWRPALIYGTISLLLIIAGTLFILMPEDPSLRADRVHPEPIVMAEALWPETLERRVAELETELADLEQDMNLAWLSMDPLWDEVNELAEELMKLEDQQI